MSIALKITILTLCLMLSACSADRLTGPEPEYFILLPPAEAPAAILLKQTLTLQAGGTQQQFLAVARFGPQHLKMVVLLPTGQKLLSLDYDGEKLVQENFAAVDLPAREILAIIQFARWPLESVTAHYLEKDGWQLETAPRQRILLTVSGPVLKIDYQPGMLSVENYRQGYRVIVNTLERTEL